MVKPTSFKFGALLIEVGDGRSPEGFTAPCGLKTKSFGIDKTINSEAVPDCEDPDAPAWDEGDVVSLRSNISGSGVLADEFIDIWENWATSEDTRNVRVTIGDHIWEGAYHLTRFEITADLGSKVAVNVEMQSSGEVAHSIQSDAA